MGRLGWAGLTGLASRRVAGWAGPEPSLRHVRQAWPAGDHAFQDKKAIFSDFAIVSTFSTKMDPWSWTPKISRPAGQDFGPADMGCRQNFGGRGLGEGKSEDSLWRRDLSALGPFGAEANLM